MTKMGTGNVGKSPFNSNQFEPIAVRVVLGHDGQAQRRAEAFVEVEQEFRTGDKVQFNPQAEVVAIDAQGATCNRVTRI